MRGLCALFAVSNAVLLDAAGPVVIATWFPASVDAAWASLSAAPYLPIDAAVAGCSACEELQCDGTVGFGGSPDSNGESTLDALVMEGSTLNAGSVTRLRRVKNAVGVARAVMVHTDHTILTGDGATEFAISMGFSEEDLSTPASRAMHQAWLDSNCQPNFWRDGVTPDPRTSCGPYSPLSVGANRSKTLPLGSTHLNGGLTQRYGSPVGQFNHDTVSLLVLSQEGRLAVATSTNGARHKIAGRVADSGLVGSGAYVDDEVGACGATGDGDVMMRFLPCFHAVEKMRQGASPQVAAEEVVRRIASKYPSFAGSVITLSNTGQTGAASVGWSPGTFSYAIRNSSLSETISVPVPDLQAGR